MAIGLEEKLIWENEKNLLKLSASSEEYIWFSQFEINKIELYCSVAFQPSNHIRMFS